MGYYQSHVYIHLFEAARAYMHGRPYKEHLGKYIRSYNNYVSRERKRWRRMNWRRAERSMHATIRDM